MSITNSSTATYSARQVMVSLAYLAYCGDLITTPSPEVEILKLINAAIPQIPPVMEWAVVWGPKTYTTPGSLYQDNMLFVAQNTQDTSQFAIAIRGTNSISDLDWLLEDLDVLQMMPWPPGSELQNPPGPMISESTSIDLQLVLNHMPSDLYLPMGIYNGQVANPPLSVLEFLKSQTSDSINLCVTGHSLGGCVAGTLALYLKENVASWDVSGSSVVSSITFAAPTAGNTAFATRSDAAFSGGAFASNWESGLTTAFDAVRCSLDVAPMGWIASNIYDANTESSPIFAIYEVPNDADAPQIAFDFEGLSYEGYAAWEGINDYILPPIASLITPQDYTQTVREAVLLTGTINQTYTITDAGIEDTFEMFMQQATYQHSNSYPILLNVPQLNEPSIIVENTSTATAASVKTIRKPVWLGMAHLLGKSDK